MSAFGRTAKNKDSRLCPGCQKENSRCSIRYGGKICDRCDGKGNYKLRNGKTSACFNCDAGLTKDQCHCHKDDEWYYFDTDLAERPPLKPSSPRAVDARIDQIYSAFLDRCYLTDDWRKHLTKERNLSDNTILRAGFVTLPPQIVCNEFAAEIAESLGPPVGVPGFYEHEGQWCFRRTLHWRESGLVTPYRNSIGQIVMLQVRSNGDDPKRRYMCISGAPSFVSHAGTGSGAPPHWLPFDQNAQTALITEGGLKATVIKELWERMGREPKFGPYVFIGTCGTSIPEGTLGELMTAAPKVKRIILAFDREVEGTAAAASVDRVKSTIKKEAVKWGLLVADEPGGWRQDGERKFDDYLRGLA